MSKLFQYLALLVVSLAVVASPALAVPGYLGPPEPVPTSSPGLSGGRLRACEARQANIQTRAGSLLRLSTNMFTQFEEITARVQTYYGGSGLTVANYDELVADIASKKAAAETAVATAQSGFEGFDCQTGDPKEVLSQYRSNMQLAITAMREYRTSIRNLIVAVRSAAGAGE